MKQTALKMVVDYLEREIPKMKRNSRLFRTLKAQLLARGYWKNLPRGKQESNSTFARTNTELAGAEAGSEEGRFEEAGNDFGA